jgi:ketosteroid isomerase-like protein
MSVEENIKTIEDYYRRLSKGDFEKFISLHAEDVIFNLAGRTPVSGRFIGRAKCIEAVLKPVAKSLQPGKFKFAKKWRIMAADENRVVAIMQGGGTTKNDCSYEQTYCQIFTLSNGKILEVHEFFDTALAEAALFNNRLQREEIEPTQAFDF